MTSIRVSSQKLTATISILLIVLIGITLNVNPSAQTNIVQPKQVATSPNPAWPNKCGIKLGLLVDRSNSISTSEGTQLKTAAKGFVDALAGTPSQIAVAQFRKTASQTIGFTSVTNPAGVTAVKTTIDGYGFGTDDDDGSTNWDAAFQSQKNLGADVVVILTDGNPTSRNIDGSGGTGSSDNLGYNLDAGITSANEVKANGARIVAVGIGSDVDTNNLKAISGPTNNGDYFTSSFETLNAKLIEIAQKLCGGTVTVQKLVKNSDGSYTPTNDWNYISTNAVVNSKTTAGTGTAEFKFENAPKNTVITETLKPGYALESIECKKNNVATGTPSGLGVALTINANDIISCTFKNKPTEGTVSVQKLVKNDDGTYSPANGWDFTASGATDITKTTAGNGSALFSYVNTPKASTITETLKTGYSIESVECRNANNQVVSSSSTVSVNVNVATNDALSCIFKNTRDKGTIQVKKVAVGGNGTFNFTSNTTLGNFGITTVGGSAQTNVVSIPTGTYNIAEVVPAGWTLTGTSCTGATPSTQGSTVSISITKNVDVVCTFANTRDTATLRVVKNATGGNGTFGFTSNTALGNFNLTTVGGTAQTSSVSIDTGSYDISEVVPAGWSLTNLSCANATTSVVGSKITINATKNAAIVCTFANTRDSATLRVKKIATGGDGTFGFTSNTALGNFNLTTVGGSAQTQSVSVPTGTYNLTEAVSSGWTLTASGCEVVNFQPITGFIQPGTFINGVTVGKGQDVVCTFTNTRDTATIQVVKIATGGNGTFGFTSNTGLGNFDLRTVGGTALTSSVSVDIGSYEITEGSETGWTLTGASCTGATFVKDGSKLTVEATKNAAIVCTFENSRDTGSLQIQKFAIGGDSTFGFETNTPLGSFDLETQLGIASTDVVAVDTGEYNLAEIVPANWELTNISCSNESVRRDGDFANITIDKGQDVVCTFTNTRDVASLQIVVIANGGENTFPFETNTSFGDFNLSTVEGEASTEVQSQPTGEYNLAELVPTGWTLDSLSCELMSEQEDENLEDIPVLIGPAAVAASKSIVLNKGDQMVCTFVNSLDPIVLGTVIVRKPDVQVKGISATNLPTTGSNTTGLLACSITLIAGGALALAMSRKRKGLIG